ncbi:MAG: cytochrome c biogenesis protein CcsA [Methylococcales bacterium]|nr:cytochrome c biogenesis protein CcsA [Methylococcales bacterium]MCK5926200.1 cytochrome c biogenesis protein CcsA [Methylococcales bacterium]
MNLDLLAMLSFCTYLGSTLWLIKAFCLQQKKCIAVYFAWFAVIIHSLYISLFFVQIQTLDFGFFSIASMISALVALLLLLASLSKPVETLGIIIFPLAAIMLGLDIVFTDDLPTVPNYSWQMNTHIFSSVIAFSLLMIAAFQAVFLALQEKQLRCHPPKKFILSLPSLQTMEVLLFQMISVGVLLLSISLVTGILFIEDLFAQRLVHKTVLSILAWVIFSALLIGRLQYGWRGQTAVKFTLSGFLLLLLGYFGSKLVLEVILGNV